MFKWIQEYEQYVSEIITPFGLCFTFNIAPSHDVMDANLTSDDFHYISTLKKPQRGKWKHLLPPNELKRSSSAKSGLWVGFNYDVKDWDLIEDDILGGYTVIIHDAFELPTKRSKTIKLNIDFETRILLNPQLITIDESLYDYDPAE